MDKSKIRIFYNVDIEIRRYQPDHWKINFPYLGLTAKNCDELEQIILKRDYHYYKVKWV